MTSTSPIFIATEASSAIEAVGYDGSTLRIQFRHGGRAYDYLGVPRSVVQSFVNADSPGRYFGKFIRDRFPARVASESMD